MTCAGLITLLAIPIGQIPPARGERPVATTLLVRGDVRSAEAGGQLHALYVSAKLAADTRVTVNPGAEAIILFHRSGRRERLKPVTHGSTIQASEIVVGRDGCRPEACVEVLESRDVQIVDNLDKVPPLIRGGGVGVFLPRGDVKSEVPDLEVMPAWGSVVLSGRPMFSWPLRDRPSRYRVRVLAAGQPLWTRLTDTARLPYPENEKPLALSQRYTLEVIALSERGGEVAVVAGSPFRTVPKGLLPAMERLKALAGGADTSDQALAAQVFLHHDVFDEALPLFQRLEKAMPADPAVQAGLSACYDRMGKKALACAASCLAEELLSRSESPDRRP